MSKQCENEAALRYTWPGREESFICIEHAPRLMAIADAMGLPLQVIPLDTSIERDQQTCRQVISK